MQTAPDQHGNNPDQADNPIGKSLFSIPNEFQLVESDGRITSGWKLNFIDPQNKKLIIVNAQGNSRRFSDIDELKDEIEKTAKYKAKLKANVDKIKLIPKEFELIAEGILYPELHVARINLDGEFIVATKDKRLEWQPMTIDRLLDALEATRIWHEQQQALQIKSSLQTAQGLEINTPAFARTEVQTPPENVQRSSDVLSVGDSHGNYKAFIDNLSAAGVIDKNENWSGKNKKVVIHGDILADRNNHSMLIMKKIRELQAEAKETGGAIVLLAGNHEDFATSYLSGTPTCDGANPVMNYCLAFGSGLMELMRDFGEKTIDPEQGFLSAFAKISNNGHDLGTFHQTVLKKMREDPEGMKLLEQICEMKLAEQIDDALYLHSEPTYQILQMLEKEGKTIGEAVDKINAIYSQGLKHQLLGKGSTPPEFDEVRKTFLNTSNRTNGDYDDWRLQNLNRKGINYIFHGHTHTDVKDSIVECGGVRIVGVDHSNGKDEYLKPGYKIDGHQVARSIGGIEQKKGKLMENLNLY